MDPSRKVKHLGKVVWDRKNHNRGHQVYQVTSSYERRQSQKANVSADEFIERNSSMLDKIASKTVHKDEDGDR